MKSSHKVWAMGLDSKRGSLVRSSMTASLELFHTHTAAPTMTLIARSIGSVTVLSKSPSLKVPFFKRGHKYCFHEYREGASLGGVRNNMDSRLDADGIFCWVYRLVTWIGTRRKMTNWTAAAAMPHWNPGMRACVKSWCSGEPRGGPDNCPSSYLRCTISTKLLTNNSSMDKLLFGGGANNQCRGGCGCGCGCDSGVSCVDATLSFPPPLLPPPPSSLANDTMTE
mmetsp:Transcript_11389/g.20807  ORF Transcript_11389/g.20807 Transcript_11389/m.20807 type:complete len:225 (-) Transcript_11389:30-704(-)